MGAEADSTSIPQRQGDAAEVLDLAVTGVAHGGWCVARDAGGRVVFVRHALPGEQVRGSTRTWPPSAGSRPRWSATSFGASPAWTAR